MPNFDNPSTPLKAHQEIPIFGKINKAAVKTVFEKASKPFVGWIVWCRRRDAMDLKLYRDKLGSVIPERANKLEHTITKIESSPKALKGLEKKLVKQEQLQAKFNAIGAKLEAGGAALDPKERQKLEKEQAKLQKALDKTDNFEPSDLVKARKQYSEAVDLEERGLTDAKIAKLSPIAATEQSEAAGNGGIRQPDFLGPIAVAAYARVAHKVTVFEQKEGGWKGEVKEFFSDQVSKEKVYTDLSPITESPTQETKKFNPTRFLFDKIGIRDIVRGEQNISKLKSVYSEAENMYEAKLEKLAFANTKGFVLHSQKSKLEELRTEISDLIKNSSDKPLSEKELAVMNQKIGLVKEILTSLKEKGQTVDNNISHEDLLDKIQLGIDTIAKDKDFKNFNKEKEELDNKLSAFEAHHLLSDRLDSGKNAFIQKVLRKTVSSTGSGIEKVAKIGSLANQLGAGFFRASSVTLQAVLIPFGIIAVAQSIQSIYNTYKVRSKADDYLAKADETLKNAAEGDQKERYEGLKAIAENVKRQQTYAEALAQGLQESVGVVNLAFIISTAYVSIPLLPLTITTAAVNYTTAIGLTAYLNAKRISNALKLNQTLSQAHATLTKNDYERDKLLSNKDTMAALKERHLKTLYRSADYALSQVYNWLGQEQADFVKNPTGALKNGPTVEFLKDFGMSEADIKAVLRCPDPTVGVALINTYLNLTTENSRIGNVGETDKHLPDATGIKLNPSIDLTPPPGSSITPPTV